MRKLTILFIILSAIALLSCDGWMDFSQPKVTSISPEDNESVIDLRPVISIKFTKEMNKAITEKSLKISGGKSQAIGRYRWVGNELFFDLQTDLDLGQKYTITMSSEAECLEGNNLPETKEQIFFTGTDRENPTITTQLIVHSNLTTTPLTDGYIGVRTDDAIQFCFSESMSQNQLDSKISVKPAIIGSFRITPNDQCFTFKPYRQFEHSKIYTFTVSVMEDLSGNPVLEDRVVTFTCGSDLVAPNLVDNDAGVTAGAITLTEGELITKVEKDSDIVIKFSEPMDRLSTLDAITIDPPVDYSFEWDGANNSVIMKLNDNTNFELNKIYTLTIKKSAKDIAGNEMKNYFSSVFRVDGEGSQFIHISTVEQIGKDSEENDAPIEIKEPFSPLDMSNDTFPKFYYIFNRSSDADDTINIYHIRIYITDDRADFGSTNLNKLNAMNSVSFTFDSSYDTVSKEYESNTIGIFDIKIFDTEDISKSAIDLFIYGLKDKSYYRLKIKGKADGLISDDGNYLEDDYLLILQT